MKRFLIILLVLAMLQAPPAVTAEAEPSAIPEAAYDAVCADVWDEIEAIEAEQIHVKRGKNASSSDYAAIVDEVVAAVEASDTYVENSICRNGAFFTWETTEGVVCGYAPRLRAQLRNSAIADAEPDELAGEETDVHAARSGSPYSMEVAVFQPYFGLDPSFKKTYAEEGDTIARALGGSSVTYTAADATIDAIADALERCAVVIFDSHGETDYQSLSGEKDHVSRANTSYICLQTGTGLTTEDMAEANGAYGAYHHAFFGGKNGAMRYYCVDGTAIANHMEKNAPNSMLWSAICYGMSTDGLHAPLREKGVEIVYGYSRAVSFNYDYKCEKVFWDGMTAGETVAEAAAAMKRDVGEWDGIKTYQTIEAAHDNDRAFPVVVSSEDTYPGNGKADNLQTVCSTWELKYSGQPTDPTAPVKGAFALTSSLNDGDRVVIYHPERGAAIKNEISGGNCLAAQTLAFSEERIADPEACLVWTIVDNGDGTYSFTNGAGRILCRPDGEGFALTNDANCESAEGSWVLTWTDGLAYIAHASFRSGMCGVYIGCEDAVGFAACPAQDPAAISENCGFRLYAKLPCEHSNAVTAHKDASCTSQGYDRLLCGDCGEVLSEETIPALGHALATDAAVAATCTETGLTEGSHCTRCDYTIAQETVPAVGHSIVTDAAVAATCTETGLTEGKHCTRCGYKVAQKLVSARGHSLVNHAAKAAACRTPGWEAFQTCSRCAYSSYKEIAALGHNFRRGVCLRCGEKDPNYTPADFRDTGKTAWYYDAVDYAVSMGLMNGVGDGRFDPDGGMTRAMLVTVLWRHGGSPDEGAISFTDVPADEWYAGAVAWAAENEIVGGVGGGKFDPNGNITREQMAAILFRYSSKKDMDMTKRGDLSGFPDQSKVSEYAKEAIAWAVGEGIIGGSDGRLLPQGNATRAQVAAILMRFIENIVQS